MGGARLAVVEAGLPLCLLARDVSEPHELLHQVFRLLLHFGLEVVCAAGVVALLLGDELDGGRDVMDAMDGAGVEELAAGDGGGDGGVGAARVGDILDIVGAQLFNGKDLSERHHIAHRVLTDEGDADLIFGVDYSPFLPAADNT